MRIFKILAAVVVALALGSGAMMASNLDLRGITYNSIPLTTGNFGGGAFSGAKLDGVTLDWVYCVQKGVNVYLEQYPDTIVDTSGVIHNSAAPPPTVAQAARIAYLLDTYANGATKDTQIALQAAIWNVSGQGDMKATASQFGLYTTMINSQGVGNVGNYLWLTPAKGTNTLYQGLVTRVPDGGMTLMLLGGALVGLETLRRRSRV